MKKLIMLICLILISGCASVPRGQQSSSYRAVDWNRSLFNCPAGKMCNVHLEDRWNMAFLNVRDIESRNYKCLILHWRNPSFDITGSHESVQYLCLISSRRGVWNLVQTESTERGFARVKHEFTFSSQAEALEYGSKGLLAYWERTWRGKRL